MDYRFLVQASLKKWEAELVGVSNERCPFCQVFRNEDNCNECPLKITSLKSCVNMVLNGGTWSIQPAKPDYIRGCISFYKEWLETGVMPTVEYR